MMTGLLVNVGQLMDSELMEEAKYSEKTYICAIFSITNHKWPDLGWNLCFHSGKPMTNSYCYYHCYFIISYYSYYCLPVILWLLYFLLLQWIVCFRNGTSVILASQVCACAMSLLQPQEIKNYNFGPASYGMMVRSNLTRIHPALLYFKHADEHTDVTSLTCIPLRYTVHGTHKRLTFPSDEPTNIDVKVLTHSDAKICLSNENLCKKQWSS